MHSWKPFCEGLSSSSVAFLKKIATAQKRRPFIADSDEGTVKNQLEPAQESMGDCTVLSHCFAKKYFVKIDRCAEQCRVKKPTVGSTFFWAFPSECIRKATKDVNHIYLFTATLV